MAFSSFLCVHSYGSNGIQKTHQFVIVMIFLVVIVVGQEGWSLIFLAVIVVMLLLLQFSIVHHTTQDLFHVPLIFQISHKVLAGTVHERRQGITIMIDGILIGRGRRCFGGLDAVVILDACYGRMVVLRMGDNIFGKSIQGMKGHAPFRQNDIGGCKQPGKRGR